MHPVVNADSCREAAYALNDGLYWAATKEGADYWRCIYERLLEYADRETARWEFNIPDWDLR